jgi:hypothetical protein
MPENVLADRMLSDAAKVVYAALAMLTHGGRPTWAKQATIGELVAKEERTVRRLLSELEKGGWLEKGRDARGWRTYRLLRGHPDAHVIHVRPGSNGLEVFDPDAEVAGGTGQIRPIDPARSDRHEETQGRDLPEKREQLSLLAAVAAIDLGACERGDYDGFSAEDLLRSEQLATKLEEMRAATWQERPRPVRSAVFRKAWKQLVVTEERKPSDIVKAIRGMRRDDWAGRRERNGWEYLARSFDRWVQLDTRGGGAATAIGAEPKREDYETQAEWADAVVDFHAARRKAKR